MTTITARKIAAEYSKPKCKRKGCEEVAIHPDRHTYCQPHAHCPKHGTIYSSQWPDPRIAEMAAELAAKDREAADLARALVKHASAAEVARIRTAARERR